MWTSNLNFPSCLIAYDNKWERNFPTDPFWIPWDSTSLCLNWTMLLCGRERRQKMKVQNNRTSHDVIIRYYPVFTRYSRWTYISIESCSSTCLDRFHCLIRTKRLNLHYAKSPNEDISKNICYWRVYLLSHSHSLKQQN